jgi:hypothetical protein
LPNDCSTRFAAAVLPLEFVEMMLDEVSANGCMKGGEPDTGWRLTADASQPHKSQR